MKKLLYIMIIIVSSVITEVVLVITSVNNSEEIFLLQNKIVMKEENLKQINNDLNKKNKEENNLINNIKVGDQYLKKITLENKKIKDNITNEKQRIVKEKEKEEKIITQIKNIKTEKPTEYFQRNKPAIKTAYLTFDDGPSKNTFKILEILNKNNIKATFFVNGHNSSYATKVYKAIVNNGHSIGNHTYTHEYKNIYKNIDEFVKDFNKLQRTIKKSVGFKPTIVRFPGGSNNTISHEYGGSKIMGDLSKFMILSGYTYFDWNVDCSDATVLIQDKNKIVDSVIKHSKNNDSVIILMHDSYVKTTTVDALPQIIEKLKEQGFQFKPLTQQEYTIQFLRAKY